MQLMCGIRRIFQAKQVVQRTERSVFFNLINRHLSGINVQFDKTAPAVELMRADFPDIFGTAIWTFHYGDHLSVRLFECREEVWISSD